MLLSDYKIFDIVFRKYESPQKIMIFLENINREITKKLKSIESFLEEEVGDKTTKYKLKKITTIATGGTPSTFKSEY
jgi:hypothetical protein